jgi:hypothetical protein
MKFNVGDIIRSKNNMTMTTLQEEDEDVDKGQYFIVVSYGERKDYSDGVGHTILCQKSGSHSFWDEENAPLNESFNKV